ncbi:DL-endopeptidase inhibitor IseA family protein [Paenibacillus sp. FSL L8-0463]|uniref:DL-endopeptidase inhibitor IseA family protein n=1 Tax=Paenibacillus sp. FSL L8-0463 TaxID=2954687 RepID=UPI0031191E8D
MPRITQSAGELKRFIENAESVWVEVFYSADTNRVIIVDGREYLRLPLRFSTRAKVLAYFRRYWGIVLSNRMFCNLLTVTRNGRLYVIAGDTGPLPYYPRRLRVTSRTSTRLRVTASLSFDVDTDEGTEIIRYLIARSGERLTILDRSNKAGDPRYQPCR